MNGVAPKDDSQSHSQPQSQSQSNQRCSSCNSQKDRLWLNDVRLRGTYRRLCTSCVLKLHSSYFCSICLEVYPDGMPPENASIKCPKCPSSAHSACVAPESVPNYSCPCCAKEFSFLAPIDSLKNCDNQVAVDLPCAKIILAAAQIAAISMNRAAAAAWAEANRKVRDSAVARKKAREALLMASQQKVDVTSNHKIRVCETKKRKAEEVPEFVKTVEIEKQLKGSMVVFPRKCVPGNEEIDKSNSSVVQKQIKTEESKPKIGANSSMPGKSLRNNHVESLNSEGKEESAVSKSEDGSSNSSSIVN